MSHFILFHIFEWPIYLYGVIFVLGYWLILYQTYYVVNFLKKNTNEYNDVSIDNFDSIGFYTFLGVVLGGRIGYVLFFDFNMTFSSILQTYKGGMSFHGALIMGIIF